MLNPSLTDQLARQRIAELHAAARRERLPSRTARLPRTRLYASRMLITLGRASPPPTRVLPIA